MQKILKKFYLTLLFAALIFYVILFATFNIILHWKPLYVSRKMVIFILIFSTITSLVFPIWFRIIKFNRLRKNVVMNKNEFLKFEKILIVIPQISVWIYFIADIFAISKMPRLYLMILGLYSVFYYFPSEKRIKLEKRIFRIIENEQQNISDN